VLGKKIWCAGIIRSFDQTVFRRGVYESTVKEEKTYVATQASKMGIDHSPVQLWVIPHISV